MTLSFDYFEPSLPLFSVKFILGEVISYSVSSTVKLSENEFELSLC